MGPGFLITLAVNVALTKHLPLDWLAPFGPSPYLNFIVLFSIVDGIISHTGLQQIWLPKTVDGREFYLDGIEPGPPWHYYAWLAAAYLFMPAVDTAILHRTIEVRQAERQAAAARANPPPAPQGFVGLVQAYRANQVMIISPPAPAITYPGPGYWRQRGIAQGPGMNRGFFA